MDKALAVEENRLNSFNQTTNIGSSKPIGLLYAKKASYLRVSLLVVSDFLPVYGVDDVIWCVLSQWPIVFY